MNLTLTWPRKWPSQTDCDEKAKIFSLHDVYTLPTWNPTPLKSITTRTITQNGQYENTKAGGDRRVELQLRDPKSPITGLVLDWLKLGLKPIWRSWRELCGKNEPFDLQTVYYKPLRKGQHWGRVAKKLRVCGYHPWGRFTICEVIEEGFNF